MGFVIIKVIRGGFDFILLLVINFICFIFYLDLFLFISFFVFWVIVYYDFDYCYFWVCYKLKLNKEFFFKYKVIIYINIGI